MSISTCQWVYHLPKPARRLSAKLFSSCNKTQYFDSDRSPRRGNLILGLAVSEIFETRLSVFPMGVGVVLVHWSTDSQRSGNSGSSLQ